MNYEVMFDSVDDNAKALNLFNRKYTMTATFSEGGLIYIMDSDMLLYLIEKGSEDIKFKYRVEGDNWNENN